MIDYERVLDGLKACLERNEETIARIDTLTKAFAEQPEQKFFVDSDGKITPLPVQKHGHWIPVKSPTGVEAFGYKEFTVQEVTCSECGFTEDVSASAYLYCPNCGARMDEEVKRNE